MVVEKEVVDDYEKRMRGLFLPSLFAGDEVGDYVGNSARDRRLRAAVVASGGAGFGGPHGGVLGGKGMVAGGVKGVTFSDKKPVVSGTGGAGVATSTDVRPGSGLKRVSGRPLSGSLMRQNGAAPRVAGAVRVPSAKGKKPGTETAVDRSRKLSTAMSKAVTPPAGAAKPRKSIATVNSNDIDVPDDLRVVDIRWDLALYSAFKQNRIKKSVLEDILKPEDETNEVRILRAKQDKIDLIGAAQVRRFYQMNVGSRNDKELDVLDSILGKYKCFAKLSPVVRYKLYNCCSIETHPRGTVVIREGHQAKYWYIILSGECLQQLRPDTPMSVTTRVQIGGSVGEFASVFSSVANETRHVRATCLMRTEFLRVEKGDFQAISREARGLDSMVFEFFTTVPAFFGVERLVLQSLCQRSIVRKFDADQVMLRAGEMCSNMYFIMRGKVRALHLVSFIKVDCGVPTTNNIDRRHKYILSPCGQNANAQLKPGDEIVRELATVLDLSNGMSFPPMKPSKVVQEQEEAAAAAEAKANGGISFSAKRMSMKPAGDVHALPCPFHFVVVDRLEVIVIAIQDLIEILPPETLKRVQEHRSMTDVSCQEIEERYMSALGWRETENSGSKTLRIDHFSKDGSWSHPVVKNKFKNHDYDPFDIPGKKSGGGTGSVGNLLNPEKRQKSLLELMVDGL
ncbi:hypothetical protein BCR33DRAFT_579171 [Rhizoclosmatium globosum]|uniref:Cyclic nucleotide-binding domain-containing protein n=1 Tax=Rhizoclosmatium globosum TaxID=329046 RepID=A0A1Y2B367_9FUNG|nr:hypothetical protein BCR33DRAFT_579171 [Rhizoclosmatium globosum]|eukprot:ORY29288.1 hypothetical protein BCR33DRAFT_579171 [Rhizoclosmatium globosum]